MAFEPGFRPDGQSHGAPPEPQNPFGGQPPAGNRAPFGDQPFGDQPPVQHAPFGQQPWGAPPPQPGPRRSRVGLIAAVATIVVVLVGATAGVTHYLTGHQRQASPPPQVEPRPPVLPPTEPPPSATPTPTGTPTPGSGPNYRRDPLDPIPTGDVIPGREELTDNPIYDQPIPDHPCAVEIVPLTSDFDAERRHLQPLFACAQALHRPALEAAASHETPEATFDVYADPATTPCGEVTESYTGVYCSLDAVAQLDLGWAVTESDPSFRPSYGYPYMVVFHEYGHHIQDRMGVFSIYEEPYGDQAESTRRLELQAECFGAIAMARSGYVDAEWRDAFERGSHMGSNDSATHGSAENRYYWTYRGWNAQTYGDCNTWIAPSDLVR